MEEQEHDHNREGRRRGRLLPRVPALAEMDRAGRAASGLSEVQLRQPGTAGPAPRAPAEDLSGRRPVPEQGQPGTGVANES